MEKEAVKSYLPSPTKGEPEELLSSLSLQEAPQSRYQHSRRELLNNKQGCCVHCGHTNYVKFGKDKGSQRYKCKSCKRSFTEYSGTWMAGLHHKDKIDAYLQLMLEEQSLDKLKVLLKINKKTAFDWRHKILSSIEESDKSGFTGITESEETFFLHSEKGKENPGGKPGKRRGRASKKGINEEHIAVIVTQDRKNQMDLTVATAGRLKKSNIEQALKGRLTPHTVLCTDSHVSYKGFAIDHQIEHHPLPSDLKQRVKDQLYHIQHVNFTHNRLKKWIETRFWGVSTKYLQQYLNWFRIKEALKASKQYLKDFMERSIQDIEAYQRYRSIPDRYELILATQK